MKVAVLGAGVTGLATAWFLLKEGHDVAIIDRRLGVALETSFANGGQLSYSYVAPLASAGVLPKIPPWILRRDSPLRFRPKFDPDQWRWCIEFILACNERQAELTTRRLLALSLYSRSVMHQLVAEEGIEFHYARSGKLILHSSARSFERAKALLDYQMRLGCEQEALDADGCVNLEPALAHVRSRLFGGIYTASEDTGDCYLFCKALEARMLADASRVRLHLGCEAKRLIGRGRRIVGIKTNQGVIEADCYVLALGSGAPPLVRSIGIRLPIYPLKGYSLTLPVVDPDRAPRISVTDYERKVVYARLGGDLRVAGMVDLGDREPSVDKARIATLLEQATDTFPGGCDTSRPSPWCGMRPATPKGTPVLGSTPYENLLLNTGHGALGFTLAAGCARVISDLLAGRQPAVPLEGMNLASVQ
ncbi:MAG: D-amino acid dehydrogenase [Candidatus Binataceae bacterium]|nr:D-amino acid dehydrogenase [Candidatus Binataceae bacterium]